MTEIQAYVDFILEVDALKGVERRTRPLGLDRQENSAEHSWQIALLAAALAPQAEPALDVGRIVGMLLVHDLGEIDTGDTIVYATEGLAERKAAERAAVQRIFGRLPPARGQALLALWQEFEDEATPEARFAHALDRAMPALLNLANQGQSWRENGITHAQVVDRIGPPIAAGLPALWALMEERLAQALEAGHFGTPGVVWAEPEAVVRRFWDLMATNHFERTAEVLADDFTLDWPQSGERIRGAANFARMNADYPAAGPWRFTLNRLVVQGEEVVTEVDVTDGQTRGRAISFFTVAAGRVRRIVEYWPDPFPAPAHRVHLTEPIAP